MSWRHAFTALLVIALVGAGNALHAEERAADESVVLNEATAGIPFKAEEPVSQATLVRVVGALLLALGVAYVAARVLRQRYYGGPPATGSARTIRVLETQRIAPNVLLFRVQVDDRVLLLGSSGDRLVLLDKLGPQQRDGQDV